MKLDRMFVLYEVQILRTREEPTMHWVPIGTFYFSTSGTMARVYNYNVQSEEHNCTFSRR